MADKDKEATIDVARQFADLGFTIQATEGTQAFLEKHGIASERVYKMREKRPHIADHVMDGDIDLVINTPRGKAGKADDAYIRQAAIRHKIPYITTITAAASAVKGIAAASKEKPSIKSLQEYHGDIK